MSDIDLDDIRRLDGGLLLVFCELIRHGRTTEAALKLGLSQPAISHALSRLRALFNDPLFIRKPHGLEPTRRAREVAPKIDAIIDLVSQAITWEPSFEPSRSSRRFNIAAPEFVTALIGSRLVKAFAKFAPHASFAIRSLPPEAACDALKRGEIDLALGRFGPVPTGLASEVLFVDRYCVAARRGNPHIKARLSYKDWQGLDHVFATSRPEVYEDREERQRPPEDIEVVAAVPNWLAALVIAASTDAVATCPLRLAKSQATVLGLQVIVAPFLMHKVTVSLVGRGDKSDEAIAWLSAQIRKAAA